jgi:hypothetical protein
MLTVGGEGLDILRGGATNCVAGDGNVQYSRSRVNEICSELGRWEVAVTIRSFAD